MLCDVAGVNCPRVGIAKAVTPQARKRRFTQLLLGMVFGCHVASAVLTSAATAYHAIATRTRPPHCHRPTVGISALIISAWVILGLFILAISVLFGSLPGAGDMRAATCTFTTRNATAPSHALVL